MAGGAITYALEPVLTSEEFLQVLKASTLAERRPVDDLPRIQAMLKNADIIVTAREDGRLIGISRAVTDYSYCCYLSDLAVDQAYQGKGIGKRLIAETHKAAGLKSRLILLSAPAAESYYPHIGMQPHSSCWMIPGDITRSK